MPIKSRADHLYLSGKEHLKAVKSRCPQRQTDVGALLNDILTNDSLKERRKSASVFATCRFRRGFRSLEALVYELLPGVEEELSAYPFCVSDEVRLLRELLYVLASMDTPSAHAVLVDLATEPRNVMVRASAITEMAYERECFDPEFIFGSLESSDDQELVVQTLWTIAVRLPSRENRERNREVIAPFLSDERFRVREAAIYALSFWHGNRDLILPFQSEIGMRDAYEQAMKMMDLLALDDAPPDEDLD